MIRATCSRSGVISLGFVLDMMEQEPPKVDSAVLPFLKSEALHPADFTISANLARPGHGREGWRGRRAGTARWTTSGH
jgi:hypothetical protein